MNSNINQLILGPTDSSPFFPPLVCLSMLHILTIPQLPVDGVVLGVGVGHQLSCIGGVPHPNGVGRAEERVQTKYELTSHALHKLIHCIPDCAGPNVEFVKLPDANERRCDTVSRVVVYSVNY